MFENFKHIKRTVWLVLVIQVAVFLISHLGFNRPFVWFESGLLLVNVVFIVVLLEWTDETLRKRSLTIAKILGQDAQEALMYGELGLLTVDEDYVITWVSELLDTRGYKVIGERIMSWLPETKDLFNSQADSVEVTINDHMYEVLRKENGSTLYFKDITDLHITQEHSANKQVVLGLIHFDNYEETTQYEDEQRISLIDAKIRQAVYQWANDRGIFIKRLRNNRMILILNELLFKQVLDEQFEILKIVRDAASELDVAISLSMAFGRGTLEYPELEEMVNGALALAQSRGGDQVAIKTQGEDVVFMGGSVEAIEKRSKVRARVIAEALKELINEASDVLIVGHTEMDFDCFGAALVLSRIVQAYDTPVSVVLQGAMEEKLSAAFETYRDDVHEAHQFLSQSEALARMSETSLVIMIDHHVLTQSVAPDVIETAHKVVVIDHHRRQSDFNFNSVMVYMETAASSTSEMVSELIPYQVQTIEMSPEEANFVLSGIIIDTNRFRSRTGSRTFEAAAIMRQFGADPAVCDDFLKDNFKEFILKTKLMQTLKRFDQGIVVASMMDETILSRALISQVANQLLSVKDIEASFVISRISENKVGISARSNGNVNVHVIMEKMNGGGHFTAAALQRENTNVETLYEELELVIESWLVEEEQA
jgi:c-di-AMP phosphodiesterase-like protein